MRRKCQTILLCAFIGPTGALAQCVGDCDGDGMVRIAEIIRGVSVALGRADITDCAPLDRNRDDRVTVAELVLAVKNAIGGCPETMTPTLVEPSETPTAVSTTTATNTSTPAREPTTPVTVTPIETRSPGFSISGCVAEFPSSPCGQPGAVVILEPLGLEAETRLLDAQYLFERIPPGSYVLRVAEDCNPFGCWHPVTIEVVDQHIEVNIPILERTPTPIP